MRYFLLLCFCFSPIFLMAQASGRSHRVVNNNTTAPFKQYPVIPAFPLTLPDGTVITKNDIKKNVPTIVFVFSVDCDHCKHLTEELVKNIDQFKKTQILMITPFQVEQMKEYYNQYKIKNYSNIIMASEPTRQIMYFYDMKYFPGIFIYNKKQQLIKNYEGTVKLDQMLEAIK